MNEVKKKCKNCKYYVKGFCADIDEPCIMITYNCEDCKGYEEKQFMNEVDKKEIADIEKIIFDKAFEFCDTEGHVLVDEFARVLQEAGYGKVEDCKKEIERLKDENKALMQSLENNLTFKTTSGGKCNILNMIRKVAIKDFVKRLKKMYYHLYINHNASVYDAIVKPIDDLLKEYGIEL